MDGISESNIQTSTLFRLYHSQILTDEWNGETGFIADVISRKLENMSDMDAYLCGPPIMIETACDALYKGGVKGTDIAYDEF